MDSCQFPELDVEPLIEELEDLGKSNIRELESRFVILIAHLLKWQFQTTQPSGSWRGSIIEQRVQILGSPYQPMEVRTNRRGV